jgi:hypothetical protein
VRTSSRRGRGRNREATDRRVGFVGATPPKHTRFHPVLIGRCSGLVEGVNRRRAGKPPPDKPTCARGWSMKVLPRALAFLQLVPVRVGNMHAGLLATNPSGRCSGRLRIATNRTQFGHDSAICAGYRESTGEAARLNSTNASAGNVACTRRQPFHDALWSVRHVSLQWASSHRESARTPQGDP